MKNFAKNQYPNYEIKRRGEPQGLEPGQFKPKNEGINNTDIPGRPYYKRALNNPTRQDEGLSSGGGSSLADF